MKQEEIDRILAAVKTEYTEQLLYNPQMLPYEFYNCLKRVLATLPDLDNLAPPKIDWLPYPENTPDKDDEHYIVTAEGIDFNEMHTYVFTSCWTHKGKWQTELTVTAYMPMPEPYKKPTT